MKKAILTLAITVAALSFCQAQQSVVAAIIHHNIHSGGQAKAAADHIQYLLDLNPQKGLVLLNEANYARQHFNLPYSGWSHIWPGSPHEGRGNPTFVRDTAATLLDSWRLNMTESWEHLQPKDPRVYTAVKVQFVNTPWLQLHCINVHFPTNRAANDVARQESIDVLIAESQRLPEVPFIICGDFNMGEDAVRRRIANPIGGTVHSNANVDHIVVRDGTDVTIGDVNVVRLGQFLSDHPALRYNITFVQSTPSSVTDWALY